MGIAFGFTAFGLWGLSPLYWRLLEATPASEVLAHRIAWSLPTALVLLALARNWSWIRPLLGQPRKLALLTVSATLISVNWGVYIWAVSSDRVIEASLGYYVNPLISILLGVVLLRERLRPAQWVAVAIGALAVLVMAIAYGRVPWVALVLALTFPLYGLVKKRTGLDGLVGFSADTAFQFLPAAGFLAVLAARGDTTFATMGTGHALLLAGAGLATAVPLILFGAAAVRVPLSTLGLIQYVTPTTTFLLGLFVFGEEMPPERWAGFLLVWTALTILTWDALNRARRAAASRRRSVPVARHTPAPREPESLS